MERQNRPRPSMIRSIFRMFLSSSRTMDSWKREARLQFQYRVQLLASGVFFFFLSVAFSVGTAMAIIYGTYQLLHRIVGHPSLAALILALILTMMSFLFYKISERRFKNLAEQRKDR